MRRVKYLLSSKLLVPESIFQIYRQFFLPAYIVMNADIQQEPNDRRYVLRTTLGGDFTKSLNALAFSPDGKFLATCSLDQRIVVYAVTEGHKIITSFVTSNSPPIALAWGIGSELLVGLRDGRLLLYPKANGSHNIVEFVRKNFFNEGEDQEELADLGGTIRTLTFDAATKRLFVAHGPNVTMLRRRSNTNWPIVCTIEPPGPEYTAVAFNLPPAYPVKIQIPRWQNQVIVSYRDHGIKNYEILEDRDTVINWSIPPGNRICSSALSPDNVHIAAWNIDDGVDIYSTRRSNLKVKDSIRLASNFGINGNNMLDVEYIHDGKEIIIGSNVGTPFIINPTTKQVVQVLEHSRSKISVPIIAYYSRKGRHYIATGDRDMATETKIKLWCAKSPGVGRLGDIMVLLTKLSRKVYWFGLNVMFLYIISRFVFGGPLHWQSPLVVQVVHLVGNAGQAVSNWAEYRHSNVNGVDSPAASIIKPPTMVPVSVVVTKTTIPITTTPTVLATTPPISPPTCAFDALREGGVDCKDIH